MSRFVSLAALGVTVLGFTLATPAVGQAQGFGVHLDVGRTHVDFGRNYDYRPSYGYGYGSGSVYSPGRHRHHSHGFNDYYVPSYRQPVVVPQYHHWTPGRGHHSHGQVLVPHRGHYHVRPY